MDSVKFKVALWFKNHGLGSEDALTLILLDINERCADKKVMKIFVSMLMVRLWVVLGWLVSVGFFGMQGVEFCVCFLLFWEFKMLIRRKSMPSLGLVN